MPRRRREELGLGRKGTSGWHYRATQGRWAQGGSSDRQEVVRRVTAKHQSYLRRIAALFVWTIGAWVVLTWTRTMSQLLFGADIAAVIAVACAPLGDVAEPWRILDSRRTARCCYLVADAIIRVIRANFSLARRNLGSPSTASEAA